MHGSERHPLIEELPGRLQAPDVFELLRDRPFSFFLDSGMDPAGLGRFSFMGSDPFLVFKSCGDRITIRTRGREESMAGDPFVELDRLLRAYRLDPSPLPVPFAGGAVGYLSYDLCHRLERLPCRSIDDLGLAECCLAFYDRVLAFDHREGRAYIASTGFPDMDEAGRMSTARRRLDELARLVTVSCPAPPALACAGAVNIGLSSNFTHEEYLKAVQQVREYIAAGDVFQVNLSQRFAADLPFPRYELYRRLRRVNPAPFAAYLDFDGVGVLSASPERFLKVADGLVETRPIKGTRPRGRTTAEDEALARALLDSAKDRAENVMIVDLERNDLGRVCSYGSVRVKELWTLEKYARVFHLTSSVEGRLAPQMGRLDLLRACFPGGSITGAPKVRAMEIIDELEPTRRGIYTGSVGYFDFAGGMDLNIVIRTMVVRGRRAYFQVGGGIVYDSEPEAEYRETLDKARSLFEALDLSPELTVVP